MDIDSYKFERASLGDEWNNFIENSYQGSIFCRSEFLDSLNAKPGIWYCYKNNNIKAAIALIETDNGNSTIDHNLFIYGGIMFKPHNKEQNYSQRLSEEFRITSASILHLTKTYKKINFAFHPSFNDIRPFLWYNYGNKANIFKADIRYTSYLKIDENINDSNFDKNNTYLLANKSRRQEIRYGIKKNVITEECYDLNLFEYFYKKTFERQSLKLENNIDELINLISSLHKKKLLKMFVSKNNDNQPGSIAIFGFDEKRAYFLYGANDPSFRNEHTGTMVIWHSLGYIVKNGFKEVDLEGVNSPKRGYFKLSFGGTLKPYFSIRLN